MDVDIGVGGIERDYAGSGLKVLRNCGRTRCTLEIARIW